jgi:hypothetical protein
MKKILDKKNNGAAAPKAGPKVIGKPGIKKAAPQVEETEEEGGEEEGGEEEGGEEEQEAAPAPAKKTIGKPVAGKKPAVKKAPEPEPEEEGEEEGGEEEGGEEEEQEEEAAPAPAKKAAAKPAAKAAPAKAAPAKKAAAEAAPAKKAGGAKWSKAGGAKKAKADVELKPGAWMPQDLFFGKLYERLQENGVIDSSVPKAVIVDIIKNTEGLMTEVLSENDLKFMGVKSSRIKVADRIYPPMTELEAVRTPYHTFVGAHDKVTFTLFFGKEITKGTVDEDGTFIEGMFEEDGETFTPGTWGKDDEGNVTFEPAQKKPAAKKPANGKKK